MTPDRRHPHGGTDHRFLEYYSSGADGAGRDGTEVSRRRSPAGPLSSPSVVARLYPQGQIDRVAAFDRLDACERRCR
jgi:hypothetical protein